MSQSIGNYIGIADDWDNDKILVWERVDHSTRHRMVYDPPRYFFIEDDDGDYLSMFGTKLKKLSFDSSTEFKEAKKLYTRKYESDIQPVQRVLMDSYFNKPIPPLNFGFLDIEAEVIKGAGFSRPSDPFAPINAITLYRQWDDRYICVAVPPKSFQYDKASPIKIDVTQYDFTDINCTLHIVSSEIELLEIFLQELEPFDFISGWNSEFYDLPYIYKRIEKVFGKNATKRLNFTSNSLPREKFVERFGKSELTIQLQGRSHLDYQDMFKKFTFEGRESFRLDAISHDELGVKKLHYTGSLSDLYNNEFIKFIHYNIIDVILIKMLDDKFKFVQLVNQMAHENTVTFDAILGTTKYVDSGISNFAINTLEVRVKDKQTHIHSKVEGAIVLTPNVGLHDWIGSVDINSLYPSTIRSLNLSPEKVIGQFDTIETQERLKNVPEFAEVLSQLRKKGKDGHDFLIAAAKEEDWRGIMIHEDDFPHTLHFEDFNHAPLTLTGKEWKQVFIEQKWAISAYGTVLDQSSGPGIVPQLLAYWYSERKRLQAEKKKWTKILKDLHGDSSEKAEAVREEAHYELLQLTKKISLNSLYGALLAKGFRWSVRELMGASTTYTGRAITAHMSGTVGNAIVGQYIHLIKTYNVTPDGEVQNIYHSPIDELIYSDTDSCYFKTLASNKDEAVIIADGISDYINDSFPEFMQKAFNCQPGFDDLIKAGREVVAERGLFQARKKYMLKVVDLEGFAVNKMKAMGSEIKKSDTPKLIQKFLKDTVDLILDGHSYEDVALFINAERKRLFASDIEDEDKLLFGIAKAANNLDLYTKAYFAELEGKPLKASNGKNKLTIPGHCRAAINYNVLAEEFEKKDALLISSGDKVKVFNLKSNEFNFDTIAIPAETESFPSWLIENLEIDFVLTEEKLIDNKLEGIFSAWGYEVPTPFLSRVNSVLKF